MIVPAVFLGLVMLVNGLVIQEADRILGGSPAPDHRYPFHVSLRHRKPGFRDIHFCSGAIISENWLLTAAHCFDSNVNLTNAYVVAGTNRLSDNGESYKIFFFLIHPLYIRNENFHDIAMIRVKDVIKFNDNVQPIFLPSRDIARYDVTADFAGWGSTQVNGSSSNALQEIPLTIISNEKCREKRPAISQNQLCTYNRVGEGACYGDSGAPLVLDGILVGIASFVRPCAVGFPDVYTRVLSYIQWIQDIREKYAHIFE